MICIISNFIQTLAAIARKVFTEFRQEKKINYLCMNTHKDMLTKENVINTVSKLPDNFSPDEIVDKLIFIDKVQKGMDDSLANNVYSKEEAKQKLSKWSK